MVPWLWSSRVVQPPSGDVLLPVRLPQGAGSWAHTAHHLGDESLWHKLDLVRYRSRSSVGDGGTRPTCWC
ncbi:hypothetical protein B1B_04720 [mine drainage metagenome]|uniref:Uncharacterized protein n=1 Tax=mine drainage metagenome TaxID=410659 RepID=T1BMD6_9ZZZZ